MAGPAAQQIRGTLSFTSNEIGKITPLKARFAEYFEPRKNIIVTRYMFNSRNQKHGESFGTYMTELRRLVQDCEFGSLAAEPGTIGHPERQTAAPGQALVQGTRAQPTPPRRPR